MDHVVYLDAKAEELNNILNGQKCMIVRGATGRKLPYGRVEPGDTLYFVEKDGKTEVRARATVSCVLNSEKLTPEESEKLINDHQKELQLTPTQFKRWAGKRYLVLIGLEAVSPVTPFTIDRSEYGNMDDWLPVEKIGRVMK